MLGTLANLNIPEFNFMALIEKHDLLNFINQFAQPGVVEDDILLEIVIFVATLCDHVRPCSSLPLLTRPLSDCHALALQNG